MSNSEINSITLNAKQLQDFDQNGNLVFSNFLDEAYNEKLKVAVDELEGERKTRKPNIIELEELGRFTSHPKTMNVLNQLFGEENFGMHHIHATRQDANCPEVSWHHDYEQFPQTNRSHLMVHVFYYLNGMNGEIGDLLILPGSQNTISQRQMKLFGTQDLPGSITIDSLEPGSMIIVNSAMLHARRAKPGGENTPRYFIDISYCEKGILWPGYGHGKGSHKEINALALKNGYDRKGRYAHLYDSSDFIPDKVLLNKNLQLVGSLL
ncbi:MAG: hypothetical protein COA79_06605 [Planctomycetota bacterium]|nr:MAG: hypothetical protein COA79_06605 [Planctomycetota bacterium]